MVFEHLTPTRIVFGSGTLGRLGPIAEGLGSHALVVCGRSFARDSGVLDRVLHGLRDRGLGVTVHDGVAPDPRSDDVDRALATARARGCDLVIGLGGGSALDTAKAVGAAIDFDSVRELIGGSLPVGAPSLPVVAIPTTAGSGAEVTRGAIVTDVVRGLKAGVRGDAVFPAVALVDPDLARTVPPAVAAEVAFDALTHALESYLARRATPISDAFAEQSLRLLSDALPAVAREAIDARVREQTALAALLGGLTVATASTCLPHRLQQAMGSVDRVSLAHGRGLAIVYPAWIAQVRPFAPVRLARAEQLLGSPHIAGVFDDLISTLGLSGTLAGCGYESADIDVFIDNVAGNVDNDPINNVDPAVMRAIYESSSGFD